MLIGNVPLRDLTAQGVRRTLRKLAQTRVGEPFLAWAAADRAMFTAEQSGDPLLAAASAWRLSYMITGRKHPQEALDLAIAAAAALERTTRTPSPERLSVYGALHLAAATAAAASFDRAATESLLGTELVTAVLAEGGDDG